VQNGVSTEADNLPKSATSSECSDLPTNTTPQKSFQKWGAAASASPASHPVTDILPPPRNRSERRAQERLLKKAMKAKQAA